MMEPGQNLSPEVDGRLEQIISAKDGYLGPELSAGEQERYLRGYSFSALVFSFFYFGFMKDKFFSALSILSSIIFFPILFILPFFARKRAWQNREWRSFNQFMAVQKKWDEWAVLGLIVFIIVFSLVSYYESKTINRYLNSNGINNMEDVKQLENEVREINNAENSHLQNIGL